MATASNAAAAKPPTYFEGVRMGRCMSAHWRLNVFRQNALSQLAGYTNPRGFNRRVGRKDIVANVGRSALARQGESFYAGYANFSPDHLAEQLKPASFSRVAIR